MIWKKESTKPNALYTDIFALSIFDMETAFDAFVRNIESTPQPKKDDAIALTKRNEGNAAFRKKAYRYAMELYNDCLRFAKPGSEHISLAYANRSACFIKLNMLEKCLNDIQLAKDAGYPAHLMSKLDQRRTECSERLENGETSHASVHTELSFEPNKNFPSMANVLKVQQTDGSNGSNYMVVAKQDIDVGQTIVVDDAMFPYVYNHFGLRCNICLKENENLVPCNECATAMFCPNCHGHFLHEYECGLNVCGGCGINSDFLCVVRSILLTIKMFPSVNELMAFVEEQIRNKKNKPTHLTDFESKYQVYFNSERHQNLFSNNIDLLAMKIYPMYRVLLQVPQIKAMFESRKHQRFLMHLIADTSFIMRGIITEKKAKQIAVPSNADPNVTHLTSILVGSSEEPALYSYYPMMEYFPHSCYANAMRFTESGRTILITTRPIKRGEQVFKSNQPVEYADPKQQDPKLKCECADVFSRCKGVVADTEQRRQLAAEPAFVEIMQNWGHKSKKTINNCTTLLQKYGRMDWCDEIKLVLIAYHSCLCIRVQGI